MKGLNWLPLIIEIGEVRVTPVTLFSPLGLILFLFLVFRQLAADYEEEKVVELSLGWVLAFLLGGRLAFILLNFDQFGWLPERWFSFWRWPGINAWGGVGAALAWLFFYTRRQRWSFLYFGEKMTLPFLVVAGLFSGAYWLATGEKRWLGEGIIFAGGILLVKLLAGYRSFVWYPSGRTGFLLLAVGGYYLISRGILDFFLFGGLYWQQVLIWGGGLACLAGIYFLSGVKERRLRLKINPRKKNEEKKEN